METNMDILVNYLKEHGYNYERKPKFGGEIVVVTDDNGNYLWDAICHQYSYGGPEGYLELMGESILHHDDVEGWLTAADVIGKLEAA